MTRAKVVGFGSVIALAFGLSVIFWQRRPEARSEDKQPQTPLYRAFDPEQVTAKYAKRFKSVTHESSASGLEYVPLGELFRVSQLEGKISDDDIKAVLADLQAEFVALAKASGVKAPDPKSTIGERPIQLTMPFCYEINTRTLQGFYLTYEGGAIDVFADKRGKDAKAEWRITCMLHEKK